MRNSTRSRSTTPGASLPGRRAVVLGAAGAALSMLTACVATTGEPALTHATGPTASGTPTGSTRPSPPEPADPALPDVEEVIARHAHREPLEWGMDITGVVRTGTDAGSPARGGRVYLTLDACGGDHGGGYDERLIDGLIAANVPAVLFLNWRWIDAHPDLASSLAANPLFELGNHGTHHKPLSVTGRDAYGIAGTASAREAAMEVWTNHGALTELTGTRPRWFRPGTAHLDDVGRDIAEALGERVVGFTVNGDGGATLSADAVAGAVGSAEADDIVIAHMNQPSSGSAEGILRAVEMIRGRGLDFGRL